MIQDAREVLYGGACGGGKSDAILMAALQYVMVHGYSAIILRQTYQDLSKEGALIARAHDWLDDTDAKWDGINHCWRFPSGAVLAFGYLEHDGDEKHFKSAEYQFIGFDQVEEILEHQYKFLFSRARRLKNSHIPVRVWTTANPDGLPWVKQRFLIEGKDHGRIFIPAKLSDNPALDQEDYIKSLDNLDPVHREQLLNGNWDVIAGGKLFQRVWFTGDTTHPSNLIDTKQVPKETMRIRVWDLASTVPAKGKDPDWTSGTLSTLKDGVLYIIHVVHFQGSPQQNEQLIQSTAEADGKTVAQYMEEEGGSSGKIATDHYARGVLCGYNFQTVKPTGDKATRAAPLASAAEKGNVKVVRGVWLNDWLDEMVSFPSGLHDDQVDTASYCLSILAGAGRKPKVGHHS